MELLLSSLLLSLLNLILLPSHLLLLGCLTIFTTASPDPASLLSATTFGEEAPGQECRMGDGTIGHCEELHHCLQQGGSVLSNTSLHRCNINQGEKIYVCCRDSVQLAADLCSTWNDYSLTARGTPQTNGCVIEHSLIVGGSEASLGEFKSIARVGWYRSQRSKEIDYQCGGTLVSPHFVLTAAHCVIQDRADYFVQLGEHDWQDSTNPLILSLRGTIPSGLHRSQELVQTGDILVGTKQTFRVRRKILHPHYKQVPLYHDIALLELDEPAVLTSRVIPACLARQPYSEPKNSDTLIAAGWGRLAQDFRELPRALQKVSLPKVSTLECNQIFNKDTYKTHLPLGITNDMICAGEKGKDTCLGDSGGPLLRASANHGGLTCDQEELVGVVAFGISCGESIGVYTRVHQYLNWILRHVAPGNV